MSADFTKEESPQRSPHLRSSGCKSAPSPHPFQSETGKYGKWDVFCTYSDSDLKSLDFL